MFYSWNSLLCRCCCVTLRSDVTLCNVKYVIIREIVSDWWDHILCFYHWCTNELFKHTLAADWCCCWSVPLHPAILLCCCTYMNQNSRCTLRCSDSLRPTALYFPWTAPWCSCMWSLRGISSPSRLHAAAWIIWELPRRAFFCQVKPFALNAHMLDMHDGVDFMQDKWCLRLWFSVRNGVKELTGTLKWTWVRQNWLKLYIFSIDLILSVQIIWVMQHWRETVEIKENTAY